MKCPRCNEESPAAATFCMACGYPLALAAARPAMPGHPADKILASRAALEGERKQVTVLFADMKGSLEAIAARDPEDARRVLDPVLERMIEAVHR